MVDKQTFSSWDDDDVDCISTEISFVSVDTEFDDDDDDEEDDEKETESDDDDDDDEDNEEEDVEEEDEFVVLLDFRGYASSILIITTARIFL